MGAMLDVLVVEDDAALSAVMAYHLRKAGFAVRNVGEGAAALAACSATTPDVVVLDVMLPGLSGIEVCVALREMDPLRPGVVMVTARGSEADVVCGFDAGADDYVIKPFRPRELIARVSALARRLGFDASAGVARGELVCGRLRVDPAARRAHVEGQALRLTPTELAVLELMLRSPRRAFSRSELLSTVWQTTHDGYARNVDCHIARLRRKLERAGMDGSVIATVHGTGYRFEPDAC